MSRCPSLLTLLFLVLLLPACGGGGGSGGDGSTVVGLGQPPTATLMVTNHDNDGPGSLRQAVADAPPGAWIVFDPALPAGDIQLTAPIEVTKVLTIGGLDGVGVRHGIDGQGFAQLFQVINAALQLNDLVLHGGHAGLGGGIYGTFSDVVLVRCHMHACVSTGSGGAIAVENGTLGIRDGFLQDNQADNSGGAVYAFETATRIERTSIAGNQAVGHGGGLSALGSHAIVANCSFHDNHSLAFDGGAISVLEAGGGAETTLEVYNATITENTASTGGGINVRAGAGRTTTFIMHRSIVAMNAGGAAPDTYSDGSVDPSGGYNMIGVGGGMFWPAFDGNEVGDAITPFDPEVIAAGPLPDGRIVALPLPAGAAVDAVPAGTNLSAEGNPMIFDLRFLPRFPDQPSDIGAIEL